MKTNKQEYVNNPFSNSSKQKVKKLTQVQFEDVAKNQNFLDHIKILRRQKVLNSK